MARSWQEGTNENAEFPINTYVNHVNNNYRLSDFYIEDGSYLRLKNMQISYNLPKSWFEKIKISSFRISVGATNLFTWTNYSGFDPEIGGDNIAIGIDKGTYPQSRIYQGSFTLEF